MNKIFEFNIQDERMKKYLEECMTEDKIEYEFKVENRWYDRFDRLNNRQVYKNNQVYCLYANNDKYDKIKQYVKDFENGEIITDGIDELENADEEKSKKILNLNKILAYISATMILIALFAAIIAMLS